MTTYRLMTIGAGTLIGAGLIVAGGRAIDLFEVGSDTLAASLTIVGVILLVGSQVTKRRNPDPD